MNFDDFCLDNGVHHTMQTAYRIVKRLENRHLVIELPADFPETREAEIIILPLDTVDHDNLDSSNFQRFLLESPEMTDEEFQAIQEKRRHLNQWT